MSETIDNDTGEVTAFEPMEVSGAIAAEISQQVATAKRYPRRSDKAISTEIMSRATLDEETAAECCYSLPRAGKDIVGPSVRFAELVFASYGNMRAGARFVEIDTKDPARAAVIIEGVCIDMQMNNGQSVPVRRSITGKKGVFGADMTNIAFSAGAAIARREAILKTVPKSIWGAAWKAVLAVLQGDQKTLAARRRASIEAFSKMGVTPDRIFAVLDVPNEEAITLEHMPRLIGIWTALRDGTETIDSTFKPVGPQHETVQNPLKDDPKDGTISETIAKNADKATQAAQAHAAQADPISSGPRQRARGNEQKVHEANTVIDAHGRITKSRNGEITAPIIDQRFEEADQLFATFEEWDDATTDMPDPEFHNKSETASTEGAKSDVGPETAGKPAEQGSGEPAQDCGQDENNAQAATGTAATGVKPPSRSYDDADGYMTFVRDSLDAATTKVAVTELWGGTRADRNELLSADQIEELTKDKEAKLKALKLKDGKA